MKIELPIRTRKISLIINDIIFVSLFDVREKQPQSDKFPEIALKIKAIVKNIVKTTNPPEATST